MVHYQPFQRTDDFFVDIPNHKIGRTFFLHREAREQNRFWQDLIPVVGDAPQVSLMAVRELVYKMNQSRKVVEQHQNPTSTVELQALCLIHLAGWFLLRQVRATDSLRMDLLKESGAPDNQAAIQDTLRVFQEEFPIGMESQGEIPYDFFSVNTINLTEIAPQLLQELVLVWFKNQNPAAEVFRELFDDARLVSETQYLGVIERLTGPLGDGGGAGKAAWVEQLLAPIRAHPHSLIDQLLYIEANWGQLIASLRLDILRVVDLLREAQDKSAGGPGLIHTAGWTSQSRQSDIERFSQDSDWMPRVVLMAKNGYVWLEQLARQYRQPISRLDQIPDEELERLARWGITSLWLIGLWERSRASRRIKQMMGAEDAEASAYSLDDYTIAHDFGGNAALEQLRMRAGEYGIRLASDMVPNHMGMDSRWVMAHPERFLSLSQSPFPRYSFNGPNLSDNPEVGIYLEDHYYDRSDAAVVFLRVDNASGERRYIYHGNDGTNMPWNDTAQLDYLQPEVREAIIQTILEVARQFPIIRFDAAMTLAKQHIQRLWHPAPGSGGAIASRAQFGLSPDEFEAALPNEFWREVVERVRQEVPSTLLLAEAFWMMEGYFVRTLGMHRVYNSAFMHMLRDERNMEYRTGLKTTLASSPQILQRFVNFMNNPDEETAIEQFGKEDKYFAICTLLATLPGMPMIGHGQFEGYYEKYGMEYRAAKRQENVDQELIERHERQIVPLLRQRAIFAEVERFRLYDFVATGGGVVEDVFAYSNWSEEGRALILVNNRYADASGTIREAAPIRESSGGLIVDTLAEALAIPDDADTFVIATDIVSGLEYLWNGKHVNQNGLTFDLRAYGTLAFTDLKVVRNVDSIPYWDLYKQLNGQGVISVQVALEDMTREPILQPFRALINPELFDLVYSAIAANSEEKLQAEPLRQAELKLENLLRAINDFIRGSGHARQLAKSARDRLVVVLQFPDLSARFPLPRGRHFAAATRWLAAGSQRKDLVQRLIAILLIQPLGACSGASEYQQISRGWLKDWRMTPVIDGALNVSSESIFATGQVEALVGQEHWFEFGKKGSAKFSPDLPEWFTDPWIRRALGVNQFDNIAWFDKQAMGDWLWLMLALGCIEAAVTLPNTEVAPAIVSLYSPIKRLLKLVERSDYRVDTLLELWAQK